MKNRPNLLNWTILLIAFGALSLGCLGPSAADTQCSGVVSQGSKEFVGRAKYEDQAGLNACNKFCIATDDKFEEMYQEWLKSDQAKSLESRNGGKVSRTDATIENKKLLDYVTLDCAKRCVREANKGKHDLKTSCAK